MASTEPYSRLTNVFQAYLATLRTAEPVVNTTPGAGWNLVGPTDDKQEIVHGGKLKYFRDNDHQAPVKAIRPEEDASFTLIVVGLTLENWARLISTSANLVSSGSSPAIRRMPLKRGFTVTEYALILKGDAMSPYGVYPGQVYVPRCVVDGEPKPTFSKDGSPALAVEIHVLEDDNQTDVNRMGWVTVQTS